MTAPGADAVALLQAIVDAGCQAVDSGDRPCAKCPVCYAACALALLSATPEADLEAELRAALERGNWLLSELDVAMNERDAARERAEAIANTGHKPDCGGMDPAARECACGWLQAVDAHSYIKGLEAERDATRAEAAALRQERDAAREERDEMAGKARSYRTLLAEAEAKQRIDQEQCDRMTSEAGRLAAELAEAEAAIRALADMAVRKARLEHGDDCEHCANNFLEYTVGRHFPAVQRARQQKGKSDV